MGMEGVIADKREQLSKETIPLVPAFRRTDWADKDLQYGGVCYNFLAFKPKWDVNSVAFHGS